MSITVTTVMLSNMSGFSVLFEIDDVVEDEYKVVVLVDNVELVDIVVEADGSILIKSYMIF